MLADAAALFFQPPDALLNIRQLLLRAGFAQPGGQFLKPGLEAGHEARRDRGFLGLAPLGMAIQPDFRTVRAQHALQPDRLVRRGQRVDRLIRIKLPAAFAADHRVAVLLFFEPCDVGRRGDPGVHDDQRAVRGREAREHVLKRSGLRRVAGEHAGSADKPAAVQHEAQGDQGTVGALLFRAAAGGLGVAGRGRSKYVLVRS